MQIARAAMVLLHIVFGSFRFTLVFLIRLAFSLDRQIVHLTLSLTWAACWFRPTSSSASRMLLRVFKTQLMAELKTGRRRLRFLPCAWVKWNERLKSKTRSNKSMIARRNSWFCCLAAGFAWVFGEVSRLRRRWVSSAWIRSVQTDKVVKK